MSVNGYFTIDQLAFWSFFTSKIVSYSALSFYFGNTEYLCFTLKPSHPPRLFNWNLIFKRRTHSYKNKRQIWSGVTLCIRSSEYFIKLCPMYLSPWQLEQCKDENREFRVEHFTVSQYVMRQLWQYSIKKCHCPNETWIPVSASFRQIAFSTTSFYLRT